MVEPVMTDQVQVGSRVFVEGDSVGRRVALTRMNAQAAHVEKARLVSSKAVVLRDSDACAYLGTRVLRVEMILTSVPQVLLYVGMVEHV
jgi:hypothetical protein